MRIAPLLALAVVLTMLSGCALRLEKFLNAQVGSNTDELLMRYGAPTGVFPLSGGGAVYTWDRPWAGSNTNCNQYGCATTAGGGHVFRINVSVDAKGIVTHYRYSDC